MALDQSSGRDEISKHGLAFVDLKDGPVALEAAPQKPDDIVKVK